MTSMWKGEFPTVGELIETLSHWPKEATVSACFFNPAAPVGQRILDTQQIWLYREGEDIWLQNQEWDDGAS